MANLGSITALKDDSIDTSVTTNGAGQNTGARVNVCLNDIVDTLTGSPVVSTGTANVLSVFASAAQGLLANSALQPNDVLPVATEGVLTGNTIWVDAVNGDDSTAVVGRQDLPFAAPEAAVNAAASGYTIHVRAGTYVVGSNLAKDGVNWQMDAGAIISLEGDTESCMFSDSDGPVSFRIGGMGQFYQRSTFAEQESADLIKISNPSTSIVVECDSLICEFDDAYINSCIRQTAGSISVKANFIGGSKCIALWWDDGSMFIDCPVISCAGAMSGPTVYMTPTPSCVEKAWILSQYIYCGDTDNNEAVQITSQPNPSTNSRIWIDAQEIRGEYIGITMSTSNNYIRAMKVSAPVYALNVSGGNNWVTVQKISGGGLSIDCMVNIAISNGSLFMDCMSIEDQGVSEAVVKASGDASCHLKIGEIIVTSSDVDGILIGNGTVRLDGCRVENTVPLTTGSPVRLSGNTGVLKNCTLVAASGQDSIAASAPQDVISYGSCANTAVDGNVTVNGPWTVGAYVA